MNHYKHVLKKTIVLWLVVCLACPGGWSTASACSRATWIGRDGSVITGRTMDWPYDFNTHLYVIPRGENNEGLPGGYSWTSKYGVVVAAGAANPGGPISGVFDGMNEQGLGGNMLYLAETDFGPEPSGDKPRISWTAWLQYVLSNFGTVKEAVEGMRAEPVYLVPVSFGPGGAGHATVHLSLSDPSGDSAIMEFLDGKLVIHHGREYQVMTNSPTYEQQLTLNSYWSRQDGSRFLPRFTRFGRSLRPRIILCIQVARDGHCPAAGCGSVQRHAERLGAVGHHRSEAPQSRAYLLADGSRSHPQGLLLRVGPQSFDCGSRLEAD